MTFSDIEQKRIERAVAAFMAKRQPPLEMRDQVDLGVCIEEYSVELFEIRPRCNDPALIRHKGNLREE